MFPYTYMLQVMRNYINNSYFGFRDFRITKIVKAFRIMNIKFFKFWRILGYWISYFQNIILVIDIIYSINWYYKFVLRKNKIVN